MSMPTSGQEPNFLMPTDELVDQWQRNVKTAESHKVDNAANTQAETRDPFTRAGQHAEALLGCLDRFDKKFCQDIATKVIDPYREALDNLYYTRKDSGDRVFTDHPHEKDRFGQRVSSLSRYANAFRDNFQQAESDWAQSSRRTGRMTRTEAVRELSSLRTEGATVEHGSPAERDEFVEKVNELFSEQAASIYFPLIHVADGIHDLVRDFGWDQGIVGVSRKFDAQLARVGIAPIETAVGMTFDSNTMQLRGSDDRPLESMTGKRVRLVEKNGFQFAESYFGHDMPSHGVIRKSVVELADDT